VVVVVVVVQAFFLSSLSDLPIVKREPVAPVILQALQPKVDAAFAALPQLTLSCAYQAYLGFYNSYLKRLRWDREELVRRTNDFSSTVMKLPSPPALQAKVRACRRRAAACGAQWVPWR
jgi:ATP-dependent RNA helicase MSS116